MLASAELSYAKSKQERLTAGEGGRFSTISRCCSPLQRELDWAPWLHLRTENGPILLFGTAPSDLYECSICHVVCQLPEIILDGLKLLVTTHVSSQSAGFCAFDQLSKETNPFWKTNPDSNTESYRQTIIEKRTHRGSFHDFACRGYAIPENPMVFEVGLLTLCG